MQLFGGQTMGQVPYVANLAFQSGQQKLEGIIFCQLIITLSFIIFSLFDESLPLHAEVDNEGDTANQRYSTAKGRNGRQSQQVANWSCLKLLLQDGTKNSLGNHVSF